MKKWDYVKKADSCMKKEGVEICDEKNRRPSKKVGSNVTPIHKKICVRLPDGAGVHMAIGHYSSCRIVVTSAGHLYSGQYTIRRDNYIL